MARIFFQRLLSTVKGTQLMRRTLRWVLRLRGQPNEIALGAAIGIFVAFTPTIGIQMLLAVLLATLFGANRAAAVLPTWVTNPLTIPPIFGGTYYIGTWFWPGRHDVRIYDRLRVLVRRMDTHEPFDMIDRFRELMSIGYDVIVPMTIGGVVVGLILGAATYLVTRSLATRLQQMYAHRRRRRHAQRRQRGRTPTGRKLSANCSHTTSPPDQA